MYDWNELVEYKKKWLWYKVKYDFTKSGKKVYLVKGVWVLRKYLRKYMLMEIKMHLLLEKHIYRRIE